MAKGQIGDATHTRHLKDILKRIHGSSTVRDSLFEIASDFFKGAPENEKKLAFAKQQVADAQEQLDMLDNPEQIQKITLKKDKLTAALKELEQELDVERFKRLDKITALAQEIMSEIQGKNTDEMNSNTARALGTLQLVSPTQGKEVAKQNQKTKHLYKAIVSVRLLHCLIEENKLGEQYISDKYAQNQDFMTTHDAREIDSSPLRLDVEIPVIIASLCQDIGQMHPDAIKILKGDEGNLDEFRMLEKEDRNNLLKINYTHSLKFVTQGLGMAKYVGNSREERNEFHQNEKNKLQFIRTLLKSAVNPGDGIGNLLKVPQVYCSVVMSTKANYTYESLPRVGMVMEKGAEVGAYNRAVSECLINMLGAYPQGFGIAYIPKDSDGFDIERYEYAVVNALFPANKDAPICRVATRGLQFNAFAINHVIGKANNLFYANTRKKLEKVNKSRLVEILRELKSDFSENEDTELIPKCWHPQDFFSYTRTQNLWNKVETHKN